MIWLKPFFFKHSGLNLVLTCSLSGHVLGSILETRVPDLYAYRYLKLFTFDINPIVHLYTSV